MTTEPLRADHPEPGWYRVRRYKGGPWSPVAFVQRGDVIVPIIDGVELAGVGFLWVDACSNPTSEAEYLAKLAGTPYRDEYVTRDGLRITTDVAEAATILPSQEVLDRGYREKTRPVKG